MSYQTVILIILAIIFRMTAKRADADGRFKAIDGDFPGFGKAYSKLSGEELAIVTSIAVERLYAFNWLCGYSQDWDRVRTDT